MNPVYLDYNATTPVDPAVLAEMLPYLGERFGNPSSDHPFGVQARAAVAQARQRVASLLGCRPEEIIFTSSGSEANNLALKGVAESLQSRGRHIITTMVEHPAVLEPCRWLQSHGWELTLLPVDSAGRVDPAALRRALRPDTVLVSVMQAQNETGVLQPLPELARVCAEADVLLHTDAAQSVGKVPVRVEELGAQLISLAGHKFYAPKGVGALYVRQGTPIGPILHGAGQEGGRRAGTEAVPNLVALGKAAELARERQPREATRLAALRDRLLQGLEEICAGLRLNGHPTERLPNTLNVSFPGWEAQSLLRGLPTVAASTGSACHADRTEPSEVLLAMGLEPELALGSIRFSLGRWTTEADIGQALQAVARRLAGQRARAAH